MHAIHMFIYSSVQIRRGITQARSLPKPSHRLSRLNKNQDVIIQHLQQQQREKQKVHILGVESRDAQEEAGHRNQS